ncbi:MAG: adenylate/guanylate cyclase domain-containing protein [Rhodospirillales bacterium]|nr:adenylate/guanylate cyclase domain-containing protein [Rhodospirillales bacterium]MCB9995757.1 adenylate/guanylate cyclase domain-containing protein [Rhodospirillales bacterium]
MPPVKTKNLNTVFYGFIGINLIPILVAFFGIIEYREAMYIYWAECALAAVFALAIYANYLIVFFLLSGAMAFLVYMANPKIIDDIMPVLMFWSLYSLCWLGYVEFGKSSYYGKKIRQLPTISQLGIYIGFMLAALGFCYVITSSIMHSWPSLMENITFYKTFFGVAIFVPSVSLGLVRIIGMIGKKHFIDFLLGTYAEPQERNSIVLFLDMVGSSSIAEKLEPKKSMDLIARFIYDCGYIFRINGGDILNYTGDGLVVTWPRTKANSALAAAHAMKKHFTSKPVKAEYWRRYGMVPDFRIGMHAGTVVISQIGEEKLFLGLYGDTVNTAARLEQMNKDLGTYILLSEEVIKGLSQSWKVLLKPIGERSVRGRHEKVKVFTIYQE